jgi:putative inorganic carbon (hco3(-)) transporter
MLDSLKESIQSRAGSERLLWMLCLLFIFSISFSIAASHILLSATTFVYLYWKLRHDWRFPYVPILIPALAFAYCVFLSAVFSLHPSSSLYNAKNLALFIILPIFYDAVRDLDDVKIIFGVLILAGVISAMYGLLQFFGSGDDLLEKRLTGFMSHWMTFSGLLLILNVLLFSHLLFSRKHPIWFYPAFGLISLALLLSLTRNAWLGFLTASTVLIAMRKVRWVIAIPVVIGIVFVGSLLIFPSVVANRISSIANPDETSNRDRLQMLRSGWEIIKDYPLTGVGIDMIKNVYPEYRSPDSVFRNNQHLHNNVVQMAAENGILALIAWLWLIGKVLNDLIRWKRNVMSREEQFMIHGTIGIVVSLFIAGMFEYNFGDSEIKMLFFVLITLPYAWAKNLQLEKQSEIPMMTESQSYVS